MEDCKSEPPLTAAEQLAGLMIVIVDRIKETVEREDSAEKFVMLNQQVQHLHDVVAVRIKLP